jgi:hypothetical protein
MHSQHPVCNFVQIISTISVQLLYVSGRSDLGEKIEKYSASCIFGIARDI